jgi:hypothetical protein
MQVIMDQFDFQKTTFHVSLLQGYDMKEFVEKFYSVIVYNLVLRFLQAGQKFYSGLVAFQVYHQTNDHSWAKKGWTAKVAIEK